MTSDVMKLVRESGMTFHLGRPHVVVVDQLGRLIELARAEEREACAVAAQEFLTKGRSPLGKAVSAAIRARGANGT